MDVAEAATARAAHSSVPGLTLITARGSCSMHRAMRRPLCSSVTGSSSAHPWPPRSGRRSHGQVSMIGSGSHQLLFTRSVAAAVPVEVVRTGRLGRPDDGPPPHYAADAPSTRRRSSLQQASGGADHQPAHRPPRQPLAEHCPSHHSGRSRVSRRTGSTTRVDLTA